MKTIWWIKKDLRIENNQALAAATNADQMIALYIYEDEWINSYEYNDHQLQFLNESLCELRKKLSVYGISLILRRGTAIEVFNSIYESWKYTDVVSHQETGTMWTYKRDLAVKELLNSKNITWHEYNQFAVDRKLKNRNNWQRNRIKFLSTTLDAFQIKSSKSPKLSSIDFLKTKDSSLRYSEIQNGGESYAIDTLDSFLKYRFKSYLKDISKPSLAVATSSRLSPYIAWGNISIRQIHNSLNKLKNSGLNSYELRNIKAFESRLAWHCHFIQKLETEPRIEFENTNRGFDGMRENNFNEEYFKAWKDGLTGYPIIDACMRCLKQTGWINFRMRAMLVSFASYQLWLHWKKPADYLAKLFLDFEPGIHFSQIQMQSGVTGINTIRIYSPLKQTIDNANDGIFIKKYLPELEKIPNEYLADLSTIPPLIALTLGFKLGRDYPYPIVDHSTSYKAARDTIYTWKKSYDVQKEIPNILKMHTSNQG